MIFSPPFISLSRTTGTKTQGTNSYEGITLTRNRRATSCKHRLLRVPVRILRASIRHAEHQ